MTPTRRSVLLAGLASIAAAVGGVGFLASRPTVLRVAPPGLRVLDRRAYSILAAVADTIHPGDTGLPTGSAAGVPERIDAVLWRRHVADRSEFLLALDLLESALVGAILDGRPRSFTASGPDTRLAALQGWAASRVPIRRQAFSALKALCASAYWTTPAGHAFIGYPGPPDYGQAAAPRPKVFEVGD